MGMKTKSFLKKWMKLSLGITAYVLYGLAAHSATVIDHNCTNITSIPEAAVIQAKATLHIAYGHTSHGSQLIDGMSALVNFMNGKGYPSNLYAWNSGGSNNALDLRNTPFSGAEDLGNPNRTAWATATRTYLNAHPEVNVIIWSWCGQAETTEADINTYLNLMNTLEGEYPNVKFVYMTGHLVGSGATGILNLRNNQIRAYCQANNKILYDFADIESYDPDGMVNYMTLFCNDACNYDSDNNGSLDRNWATAWQASHTEGMDWYSCGSAHSEPLNANRKAYAAWWLWAMLGGWNGNSLVLAPASVTAAADSVAQTITLNWPDQTGTMNESSYIIQRQVDGGAWDNTYASVGSNVLTFTDDNLEVGPYAYRIVSHLDNDGNGNAVNSMVSGIASAQIVSATPPTAPSNLAVNANSTGRSISLSWTDNSNTETSFIIQRQLNGGAWNNAYATVNSNIITYSEASLSAGTYRYRVIAHNDFGDSEPTTEQEGVILDLPNPPTSLTATPDNTSATVTLNWTDASSNETGFIIQRRVNSGSWNNAYALAAANTTTYLDNNLGSGPLAQATYTYRVCAANANGNSNASNTSSAQITTSIPSKPSNLAVASSNGNLVLTWTDNSTNETSFQIERHIENGSYALLSAPAANTTTWTNTGLTGDHTYTYRIRAGNSLGYSDYSDEFSIYFSAGTVVVPTTVTLRGSTQVEDSFLQKDSPSNNYGTDSYVSSYDRYVCKFTLPSDVMNKKIVSAKMAVYVWDQANYQANQYMYIHRVTSDWAEGTVTYNTTPAFDSTPVAGMLHLEGRDNWDHRFYPEADITSLVQGWVSNTFPNYGFLLSNEQSQTRIGMKASEYGATQSTYLTISYTDQTNEAPVINALNPVNVYEGERISLDISVTDLNTGDTLTLTPSGLPAGASLSQKNETTWTLTWQTGFENAGTFNVTFTAGDGSLNSEPVVLTLTVNDVSTALALTNKPGWFQSHE